MCRTKYQKNFSTLLQACKHLLDPYCTFTILLCFVYFPVKLAGCTQASIS